MIGLETATIHITGSRILRFQDLNGIPKYIGLTLEVDFDLREVNSMFLLGRPPISGVSGVGSP